MKKNGFKTGILLLTVVLLIGVLTVSAAVIYDDNGDGKVNVLDMLSLAIKSKEAEGSVSSDTVQDVIGRIVNGGTPDPSAHYDILFIGNSYTFYHDLPELFRQIAVKAGYTDIYKTSLLGVGDLGRMDAAPARQPQR